MMWWQVRAGAFRLFDYLKKVGIREDLDAEAVKRLDFVDCSYLNTRLKWCILSNDAMDKNQYMREALLLAQRAYDMGEVPVGAVIVRNGEIIASGHNLTETSKDPTMHAEMIAIRHAAAALGGWRLTGCSMYVTCEPCTMCAGALVWSRMEELYIGTMDPKAGACGSVFDVPAEKRLNHNIRVETGILQSECSEILKRFFSELRRK